MKILLSWILEHISGDTSIITPEALVDKFNRCVAEIEHFQPIDIAEKNLCVAKINEIKEDQIVAHNVIDQSGMVLKNREGVFPGQLYVVKKNGSNFEWATTVDFGGSKQLLLPEIYISESEYAKIPELLSIKDVIIDVDNKSINHRSDLWSHRGIAREVAALFDLNLKSIDSFLVKKPIASGDTLVSGTSSSPFSIAIETVGCKKFAGLYIKTITQKPTPLWMAIRLSLLDCKPMSMLVDTTNYVLFDIGQPMHVFDAQKLPEQRIIIRKADEGEKIVLLDGLQAELTTQDLVIADGRYPVSLAGVMGGQESAVSAETNSIFLESANFDATTVRKTALFHKKRTESSMRFEKSLDPNQNISAIERYLSILSDEGVEYQAADTIQSAGKDAEVIKLSVAHMNIERKLGLSIQSSQVQQILSKLGFSVIKKDENDGIAYHITVPTFRISKDISIVEDIIEEVGRHIGYDTIETYLPALSTKAKDLTFVHRRRNLKNILTHQGRMRELYTYSFFDESFLQQIHWEPKNSTEVKNPVSSNHYRLVTTLFPNLCKAVFQNAEQYKQLRFYEWARIWNESEREILEKQVLSAILYDQNNPLNFYEAKKLVQELFDFVGMDVSYSQIKNSEYPWILPYQSADIIFEDRSIGVVAMVDEQFLHQLTPGGSACFFELDAQELLSYKSQIIEYVPASKFPPVIRDISMLIPTSLYAQKLCAQISMIDPRIVDVSMIDFFEKKEWKDKRSVTIRVVIQDQEQTLTTELADLVYEQIISMLHTYNVEIR